MLCYYYAKISRLTQDLLIFPMTLPSAPPLITFWACLKVRLVRTPLSFTHTPPSRRLSITAGSPSNSALATATTSPSSAPPAFTESCVFAAMACRCEVYSDEERMRSDRGRRSKWARGTAATGRALFPESLSVEETVAIMGGEGEVLDM